MNKIYRSKWGQYFDLSHIVSISEMNHMKRYGDTVYVDSFEIYMMFRGASEPIIKHFNINDDEFIQADYLKRIESERMDLVEAWKKYKEQENI